MSVTRNSFGSWKSPITAELIAARTVTLGQLALDGDDIYWSESIPAEGGRNAVMCCSPAGTRSVLAPPYDARTRAHEYGGGAYTVADGVIYFCHYADQRWYRQRSEMAPDPLTPPASARYADGVVDRQRRRIICVRELHAGAQPAVNTLVSVGMDVEQEPRVLVTGNDFYSTPRLSPDGRFLAWLAWDHPHMPWDTTTLYLAEMGPDGAPCAPRCIAGGKRESVFQPEFAPNGTLYFISDRSGWWNLYCYAGGAVHAVLPMAAEFGVPQWVFGLSTYAFAGPDRIVCTFNQEGIWRLGIIDIQISTLRTLDTPYTDIGSVRANNGRVVFLAATPTALPAVIEFDIARSRYTTRRSSTAVRLEPGYLSRPIAVKYETGNGDSAHAFYYAPGNHDVEPPDNEKPPLLIMSHGGPTAAATSALNLKIQYWTSRGFAVLDVNYRGSNGFGRNYREKLDGQWGMVDVDDCVHGARYVVEQGWVDGERIAIRGSSAGGYTTLCALTFHDCFTAGASYYGVSDLEALARDTHKFEAHYLDRLIGPYPASRALYRARSPIHHVERLAAAMIFFQGLDDKVVPPEQTTHMVAALKQRGLPVAYLGFESEAHGFRRPEHIRRALEAELYFYGRVFGFTPADPIEPVAIDNL